jgi:preprotein translocase subunit SecG
MGILRVFLLVIFIIVAILLVLLVLVQNEEGDSLGGVFAGGSSSAFGSRSGNILTKSTSVLGALFFALALSLALLSRTPNDERRIEEAGRQAAPVVEQGDDFSNYQLPGDTASDAGVIERLPLSDEDAARTPPDDAVQQ